MASFDAFAYVDMISPRPLLMITGTKAATKWYSEMGVERAGEPKELVVVEGLPMRICMIMLMRRGRGVWSFLGVT